MMEKLRLFGCFINLLRGQQNNLHWFVKSWKVIIWWHKCHKQHRYLRISSSLESTSGNLRSPSARIELITLTEENKTNSKFLLVSEPKEPWVTVEPHVPTTLTVEDFMSFFAPKVFNWRNSYSDHSNSYYTIVTYSIRFLLCSIWSNPNFLEMLYGPQQAPVGTAFNRKNPWTGPRGTLMLLMDRWL